MREAVQTPIRERHHILSSRSRSEDATEPSEWRFCVPLARRRQQPNTKTTAAEVESPSNAHVRFGSWLCKNAMARRTDRIDHPSDYEFRRDDSNARSLLTDLRKIMLHVFAISGFSHRV